MNSALRFDEGKLEFCHIHPMVWNDFVVSSGINGDIALLSQIMDDWFYGHKTPPLDMISLAMVAPVLAFGARKYACLNYCKGMKFSRVMNSFRRHIYAIILGEEIDAESGCSHARHAECNLLFAYTYDRLKVGEDDRPK